MALHLLLTAGAIAHLALVFLFPAGRNAFLGANVSRQLPHLTYWRPADAFGFSAHAAPRGFIRYAVFAQDGQVREGEFPNPHVRPNLRYSRWSSAGTVVSGDRPALHDALLNYLLAHLGSTPLKVELYAGEWGPSGAPAPSGDGAIGQAANRATLTDQASGRARLWKLGTHDGLTQTWKPVSPNGVK
jgi:hypothetical protein